MLVSDPNPVIPGATRTAIVGHAIGSLTHLVAISVNGEGYREILGIIEGLQARTDKWPEALRLGVADYAP